MGKEGGRNKMFQNWPSANPLLHNCHCIIPHTQALCYQLHKKGHYEGAHAHPSFHTQGSMGMSENHKMVSSGNQP